MYVRTSAPVVPSVSSSSSGSSGGGDGALLPQLTHQQHGQWRFHAEAGGGGLRPLQIVARPPYLAVLLTHCG